MLQYFLLSKFGFKPNWKKSEPSNNFRGGLRTQKNPAFCMDTLSYHVCIGGYETGANRAYGMARAGQEPKTNQEFPLGLMRACYMEPSHKSAED